MQRSLDSHQRVNRRVRKVQRRRKQQNQKYIWHRFKYLGVRISFIVLISINTLSSNQILYQVIYLFHDYITTALFSTSDHASIYSTFREDNIVWNLCSVFYFLWSEIVLSKDFTHHLHLVANGMIWDYRPKGMFEQITVNKQGKRTSEHKYPQVSRGVFSQLVHDVT